ncbi:MAG TPA: hypothetical protein VM253_03435 [Candidatus Limnocylindrales bacterium]|nr:hypothetical protein [Candidatus Limnocylindrales bacterium]
MTAARVVARLAVRELWISFRLLLVLVAFVGAGAVVAIVPAPLADTAGRLAWGLGLATLATAVVAAWSMAEERRAGRAGWLVSRAVSRGTLLVGWFSAISAVACLALLGAATLGWLAASSVTLALEPEGYVGLLAGIAAATTAAVALGLLAGIVAAPRAAALGTLVTCALAATVASVVPLDPSLIPGGAYVSLAGLREPGGSIGPGLRAAGAGLAATGLLLAAARLALDRVEL